MVEGVRRSLEANRAAYEALRTKLRVGMTERDASRIVGEVVDAVCGDEPHEFIGDFVGGVRTGSIEGPATDLVLKAGDLFVCDLSVRRGDTWSDTCRTFFLGEPTAAQRERLRLAADLHDGFQQYLAGAMFRLKAAQNYLPVEAEESRVQLEKVKDALQHTQNGLRAALWAMNEESEGPESVLQLFEYVARRLPHWEDRVTILSTGEERKIAHHYAGSLLLILQEAVGNAITHGKATAVQVQVDFKAQSFALTVTDNGNGFDVEQVRSEGHYGLGTMERRTAELGGTMQVTSAVGKGASLIFTFPM